MKSKLSILFVIVALVFVAATCNKQTSTSTGDNMQKQDTMQKSNDSMKPQGSMQKPEDACRKIPCKRPHRTQ